MVINMHPKTQLFRNILQNSVRDMKIANLFGGRMHVMSTSVLCAARLLLAPDSDNPLI